MQVKSRPAMPTLPPRQVAFKGRRDGIARRFATFITVLAAAVAVLMVAAAAVAFAIS